jgi:hypothetical protein
VDGLRYGVERVPWETLTDRGRGAVLNETIGRGEKLSVRLYVLLICFALCTALIPTQDGFAAGGPAERSGVESDRSSATPSDVPPGLWRRVESGTQTRQLTPEQKQAVEALDALAYLRGYTAAPKKKHVTVYDKERAYDGLNYYVSGHAPEAVLMDMSGKELHRWRCDFSRAFPDWPVSRDSKFDKYFRRAYLYDNGDLLGIFDGIGLVKIDKDSNLIWAYPGRCHHDLAVANDGTIYVLSRKTEVDPTVNSKEEIVKDFVNVLDAEGNELRKISLLDAFRNSHHASALRFMRKKGDVFHTNTLEVFDGALADRSPLFKRGNALIAVRELDIIAIIDLEAEKVAWSLSGMWRAQHQPTLLANGNMLLFDNKGYRGKSKVMEFDPFSQEIVWLYEGSASRKFFSALLGSCQRLPNGNTFITESDTGRAFEVTSDKDIVWEWISPHRAGENNELVATLCEMLRLRQDFPLDWLERGAAEDSAVPQ